MTEERVNSLWCLWYAAIVTAMHCYLTYLAVERLEYHKKLDWEEGKFPNVEVYVSIVLLGLSLLCSLFFVVSCIMRVDNFANDGQKLGKLVARIVPDSRCSGDSSTSTGEVSRVRKIWRHLTPIAATLHLIAATFFLLPRTLLRARALQLQKDAPGLVFHSDLDLFLGRSPNSTAAALVASTSVEPMAKQLPSLEFLNFLMALLMCMVRYPAVFWFTNKYFTAVFAVHQAVSFGEQALSYCGFELIYRLTTNGELLENGLRTRYSLLLPGTACVLVYLLGSLITFLSSIAVFEYGHRQYFDFYRRCKQRYDGQHHPGLAQVNGGCQLYAPNIVAMVILILTSICKSPMIYDWITVYKRRDDRLMLACIIMEALYVIYWIVMWFCLTLKQRWSFHIQLPYVPRKPPLYINCGETLTAPSSVHTASPLGDHINCCDLDDHNLMTLDDTPPAAGVISHGMIDFHLEEETNTAGDLESGPDRRGAVASSTTGHDPATAPFPAFGAAPNTQPTVTPRKPSRVTFQEYDEIASFGHNHSDEDDSDVSRHSTSEDEADRAGDSSPPTSEDEVPVDSPADSRRQRHTARGAAGKTQTPAELAQMTSNDRQNYALMMAAAGLGHRTSGTLPPEAAAGQGQRQISAQEGTVQVHEVPSSAENTLTRDYRHSLRDKCGQYYRQQPVAIAEEDRGPVPGSSASDDGRCPRGPPSTASLDDIVLAKPRFKPPVPLKPSLSLRRSPSPANSSSGMEMTSLSTNYRPVSRGNPAQPGVLLSRRRVSDTSATAGGVSSPAALTKEELLKDRLTFMHNSIYFQPESLAATTASGAITTAPVTTAVGATIATVAASDSTISPDSSRGVQTGVGRTLTDRDSANSSMPSSQDNSSTDGTDAINNINNQSRLIATSSADRAESRGIAQGTASTPTRLCSEV